MRVQIEIGEIRHTAEGDPDQVIKELLGFVAKAIPGYDALSKFVYSPDYDELLRDISPLVNITNDGQPILLRAGLPADQAILLSLLAAHVAAKLGKRASEEAFAEEIAQSIGKAVKTIRNTIAELQKSGLVERATRGAYKITGPGIRAVHEDARNMLAEDVQQGGKT